MSSEDRSDTDTGGSLDDLMDDTGTRDALDVMAEETPRLLEKLDDLDEDSNEYYRERAETVEAYLDAFEGTDPCVAIIADAADELSSHDETNITKTEAKREIKKRVREARKSNRDRPEVVECIETDVAHIEALSSTDSDAETRFRFVFDDGDSVVVVGYDGIQSQDAVRNAFFRKYNQPPVIDIDYDKYEDGWMDVVDMMMTEMTDFEKGEVGPCVQAIQRIREHVEKNRAYTDRAKAYSESGIHVKDEDANLVYLESSRVEEYAKQYEQTTTKLWHEMNNMDLLEGSTTQLSVGGGKQRSFWRLPREEFEPLRVETEAESDAPDVETKFAGDDDE